MNRSVIHILGVYRFTNPVAPCCTTFIVVREHGSGYLCRFIDDPISMTMFMFKEEILRTELLVPGTPIET